MHIISTSLFIMIATADYGWVTALKAMQEVLRLCTLKSYDGHRVSSNRLPASYFCLSFSPHVFYYQVQTIIYVQKCALTILKKNINGNIESRLLPDHFTAPARSSAKETARTLVGMQLVSSSQQCCGTQSALLSVVNPKTQNFTGSTDPCIALISFQWTLSCLQNWKLV